MANVYEKARELQIAIRESQEYLDYMSAKLRASENQELVAALNDYQGKQFELQKKIMLGEEVPPDAMQQMQNLFETLGRDPAAGAYLQAQMRFGMMVSEVSKTLADVLQV